MVAHVASRLINRKGGSIVQQYVKDGENRRLAVVKVLCQPDDNTRCTLFFRPTTGSGRTTFEVALLLEFGRRSGPVRPKENRFEHGRDPMEPKEPVGRTSRRHLDVLHRRGASSPTPFIPHNARPRRAAVDG
jgi:hypothetical protein